MAKVSVPAQAVAVASIALIAGACSKQSAPPMSRETFLAATARCSLRSTTYTPRHGAFLDEPLIDFRKESDPTAAHRCFDWALRQIDMESGAAHIGYIWEWRS
jgi:hypothetical protein